VDEVRHDLELGGRPSPQQPRGEVVAGRERDLVEQQRAAAGS
jgi:hypothetical protein